MTQDWFQLQAEADQQFHASIFEPHKFDTLWQDETERTSQLAFYVGRAYHYLGERDEALNWYFKATEIEPIFPWVYYELSRFHSGSSQTLEAARNIETFLHHVQEQGLKFQLNDQHHAAILQLGHSSFSKDTQLSNSIYRLSYKIGFSDYLSLLRIIESAIADDLIEDAARLMVELRHRFKLDAYGCFACSRLLAAQGHSADALEMVAAAVDLLPGSVWLRTQACVQLIELGAFVEADAAIERFAIDPALDVEPVKRALPALRFRAAVRQRKAASALAVIKRDDHAWPGIDLWVYAEAVYTFARFGNVWTPDEAELLSRLKAYLWTKFQVSDSACLAVLQYHAALFEWERVDELIQSVAQLPVYQSRDMVLRRFETACELQRLDEARSIYETRWAGNSTLNMSELILSMRFLGEMHDWNGAATIAASIIRRGMAPPGEPHSILQTIRRVGEQQRFIDLLEETGRTDTFAVQLEQFLVDDTCISQGVVQIAAGIDGRTHRVSRENLILVKPLEPADHEELQLAGFICADRAYFVSVLTLIASLAPTVGEIADWYLFLSEDVPQPWIDQLLEFCARVNFQLTVVPEDEFFVRSEGCPTDYGLFSGGRKLARSAYFRIYAAQWLLGQQRYTRALYLDSDIICQGSLLPLFELDFKGAPLAARSEGQGVEVVKAALKCGVAPEDYINSGVLVFDMDHPDLANYLRDTIWQSENAGTRLTFHDQCALNISFANAIQTLPAEFNMYLRPFKTYDKSTLDAATLLHYLDRPKPWDSSFVASHRLPWLMAATVVKTLVPGHFYQEIMAAGLGYSAANVSPLLVGS